MIWGFVGGRDFDAQALLGLLKSVPPADIIGVGTGIGSEKFVREQGPELGLNVQVAPVRSDLYDWPFDGAVGVPAPAPTRLMMLLRVDQAMLWATAREAQLHDGKTKCALEAQITDVVVACVGGKLVLMGGGRAKQALDIVKRCQETALYNKPREKVTHGQFWEVIEL